MKRVYIIHGWEGYPEENWFSMNHFSGNWNITELPVVLEELLKMVKQKGPRYGKTILGSLS